MKFDKKSKRMDKKYRYITSKWTKSSKKWMNNFKSLSNVNKRSLMNCAKIFVGLRIALDVPEDLAAQRA